MLEAIILSLALALLCAALPCGARQIRSWLIAVGLSIGIALGILGIVFSAGWYPWTDILVLLVAVCAGLLLGRVMPAKLWPFLLLLLVLSILDIVQNALPGPPTTGSHSASTPAGLLYGNFLLLLPWGRYNIGIFDLLLLTAIAEYWRKRGGGFLVALAPGVIGFLLIFAYGQLIYNGALPLIPFFTAGWLCSAGIYYYRRRLEKRAAALNGKGSGASPPA